MTTFTTNLKLTQPALGATGWGTTVNNGITALVDDAVAGLVSVDVTSGNVTLTTANGTTDQARNMFIRAFGASVAREVIVPALTKLYFVVNDCTADVTFKVSGQTGVAVPAGRTAVLRCNGTDVVAAVTHLTSLTLASALPATSGGTGLTSFTANGVLYASSTSALATGSALTFNGTNLATTGTATATKLIPTGNVTAGNGMYLPTTNTLAWSTNGAEGMRLDASGNVSIGTTGGDFSRTWRMVARNDQDAVTEIGVINNSTGASAVASIAKIGGTANSFVNWELVENSGTPYDSFLYGSAVDHVRWDFGGSERMRITSTGNVGIGTPLPSTKLHVFDAGTPAIRLANATVSMQTYVDASFCVTGTFTNNSYIITTNNTERMRLDSSGNVGINTTNPVSTLHVNGGVRAIQGLPTGDASNVGFSFGPDGDTGLFSPTTGGAASGVLVFYNNAVEVARFDNGNFITSVNNTAPTLSTNSTMSFELTSNTSLKIVVRGTDGVTRSVSLTLS